ncbi:MAG: O-antigen ligase family protein [Candidatus Melainabacteria bacterium]
MFLTSLPTQKLGARSLIVGVIVLLSSFLALGFYFLVHLLSLNHMPIWSILVMVSIMACLPLLWLTTWKNHRLCFLLTSFILLGGDFAPALTSPTVALITLPNFFYLLYLNRNSKIKFFLLPFILLSAMYFFSAFLLNVVSKPIMISYGMVLDLGWLSSLIGGMITYHIVYIPLMIYHLIQTDKPFFRSYNYILSLFINLIVIVGIFQFGMYLGGAYGEGLFRVSSIMRIATRLGPFIVISLPLLLCGLLDEPDIKKRTYWWVSIVLSLFIMLLTYTRGAVVAAVVLWAFLALSLFTSRSYRALLYFVISTLVICMWFFCLSQVFSLDFFTRFDSDKVESGWGKRLVMWKAYFNAIQLQGTSPLRSILHTMFGYGVFSERFYVFPLNRDAHNTFISTFNTFGLVGFCLYYIPYFWILFISTWGIFTAKVMAMRPRYAMASGILILFIASGLVHNKLYSPIESAYTWLLIGVLLREDLGSIFPIINRHKKYLPVTHKNTIGLKK